MSKSTLRFLSRSAKAPLQPFLFEVPSQGTSPPTRCFYYSILHILNNITHHISHITHNICVGGMTMWIGWFISILFYSLSFWTFTYRFGKKHLKRDKNEEKKCIFFSKNLVNSKKSSTFAPTNLPRFPQDQRA